MDSFNPTTKTQAALTAALLLGYRGISRGLIIEPPAFIADGVTAFMERVAARTARLVGQPQ